MPRRLQRVLWYGNSYMPRTWNLPLKEENDLTSYASADFRCFLMNPWQIKTCLSYNDWCLIEVWWQTFHTSSWSVREKITNAYKVSPAKEIVRVRVGKIFTAKEMRRYWIGTDISNSFKPTVSSKTWCKGPHHADCVVFSLPQASDLKCLSSNVATYLYIPHNQTHVKLRQGLHYRSDEDLTNVVPFLKSQLGTPS